MRENFIADDTGLVLDTLTATCLVLSLLSLLYVLAVRMRKAVIAGKIVTRAFSKLA